MKVSAVIIACNEEAKIAKALRSVSWADEILLVDSESTDQTREIAEKLGAKVVVQKWLGFSKQKQLAVDLAENDWIFSLDADEEVSSDLIFEINAIKQFDENDLADGYKIPRLSYYMNRPIFHCGWYPDWQLRFFNRTKGKWKEVVIHESFILEGKVERLKGNILHQSIENAINHHRLIGERYALLAAKQMFQNGTQTSLLKLFSIGFITFFQRYFFKFGILDGFAGFCIACFSAYHNFLKHLILWELQNKIED
jgi:glycosyltransferase involved in cell wall biosynthesis